MADATPVEPATRRFLRHVGPIAAERPAPGLASALGAFAALLGGVAVTVLGGEIVAGGAPRAVGALAALVYGGGGLALVIWGADAQRSAGVVAVTVAVPAVFGFLVLSGDFDRTDPATVVALAAVAWGALHVLGPTRGHPVLLAATLVGAWAAVVVQIGLDEVAALLDDPFRDTVSDPLVADPDSSAVAVASLLFGFAYLAVGYGLDRAGLRGTATVFLGAAIAALALGVATASTGRGPWLVGLLLLTAGCLVGFVGGDLRRRLSTWLGSGVAVLGVATLVDAAVPDDRVTAAALVALGAVALVVGLAPRVAAGMGESGRPRKSDISGTSPQPE